MPIYVTLYKFTDQGVKAVKESPARAEAATKALEAIGGKLLGLYYTMGEYDLIGIGEVPNDEAAMTYALGLGSAGNVRTTTLKAFTKEQFAEFVKKLP
jgi:uncharacterized protein with GYD domain